MASRRENHSKKREERLARERMERAKQQRRKVIMGVLALVLVVTAVAAYVMFSGSGGGQGYNTADKVGSDTSTGQITIPVSSVSTTAKFNTYDAGGTEVRFFEVVGSDGQIHVATDACDVCYANKKGYRQTGDSMTCNNCGKVFPINNIGTENTAGGCWPSFLPVVIDSDNIIIEKANLNAKAFMFQ